MMPSPLTIPALLARSVRDFGDRDYVVSPTERLSYADAERLSAVVARRLLFNGVGKGTRVGLFFPNGVEWIVWWLAVSRIGALAVPLSTMYPPAELAKVVRLADVALVVGPVEVLGIDVAERFESAFPTLVGQRAGRLAVIEAPYLRSIVLTGGTDRAWVTRLSEEQVPGDVLSAVEAEVSPADLAVMVHTSGSTADLKGCCTRTGRWYGRRRAGRWPCAPSRATPGPCASSVRCRSSGSVDCLRRPARCTNPSRCWSCRDSTPRRRST